MGIVWSTKTNKFPEVEKNAAELNGKAVAVGVFDGEMAWLASIQEYGCVIPVTDKMRGWFRSQGVNLKKSTTQITIPPRPFLRNGYDEKKGETVQAIEGLLGAVLEGDMSVSDLLDMLGLQLSTGIQTYARDLSSPANSGFTTSRKGSSNPLVDSGGMIGAITWKVV